MEVPRWPSVGNDHRTPSSFTSVVCLYQCHCHPSRVSLRKLESLRGIINPSIYKAVQRQHTPQSSVTKVLGAGSGPLHVHGGPKQLISEQLLVLTFTNTYFILTGLQSWCFTLIETFYSVNRRQFSSARSNALKVLRLLSSSIITGVYSSLSS